MQVGAAAGVTGEAAHLADRLRGRLRVVARQVAGVPRPRILSLEGLDPLCLGALAQPDFASCSKVPRWAWHLSLKLAVHGEPQVQARASRCVRGGPRTPLLGFIAAEQ